MGALFCGGLLLLLLLGVIVCAIWATILWFGTIQKSKCLVDVLANRVKVCTKCTDVRPHGNISLCTAQEHCSYNEKHDRCDCDGSAIQKAYPVNICSKDDIANYNLFSWLITISVLCGGGFVLILIICAIAGGGVPFDLGGI